MRGGLITARNGHRTSDKNECIVYIPCTPPDSLPLEDYSARTHVHAGWIEAAVLFLSFSFPVLVGILGWVGAKMTFPH